MLAEVSAPRWLDLGLLHVGSGGDQQAGAHWPGGDLVEWPSVSLRECGGPGGADCPPVVGEPLSGWPPGPADGGGHGPSSGDRRSPVSSTATRRRREIGAVAVRLDAMLDGSARTQSAPRRRGCGSTTARRSRPATEAAGRSMSVIEPTSNRRPGWSRRATSIIPVERSIPKASTPSSCKIEVDSPPEPGQRSSSSFRCSLTDARPDRRCQGAMP
jgi:hypothetical protein